jgi:hypothetical protein
MTMLRGNRRLCMDNRMLVAAGIGVTAYARAAEDGSANVGAQGPGVSRR